MSVGTLVAKEAPDFSQPAVLGNGKIVEAFSLAGEIKDKYAILFFYPLDFTFVCPSELIALDRRIDAFKERNTEVIAVSVDSQFTHNAWRNTPIDKGGIGPVRYTLVADVGHTVCRSYGVEHACAAVAFRAVFLIDKTRTVRVQIVNDLPIGREVDELIRLIDALQFHEENGEVCPAGWRKGRKGMRASPEGVAQYLSEHVGEL